MAEANIQVKVHQDYHNNFTHALLKPEFTDDWEEVVCKWDKDRSKPSLYISVAEHKLVSGQCI